MEGKNNITFSSRVYVCVCECEYVRWLGSVCEFVGRTNAEKYHFKCVDENRIDKVIDSGRRAKKDEKEGRKEE